MLRIELDDQVTNALQELRHSRLPKARREMVQQLMRNALLRTRDHNPVRTGRSRAAWDAALQQLAGGSAASPNGQPPAGQANSTDDQSTSTVTATNAVPYTPFLEYGTSRMRPTAMVRRALQEIKQLIAQLFRLN